MQKQASPAAIAIAVIVLIVVLFVIYKLTLGKSKAPVAPPEGPEGQGPVLQPGGSNVPAPPQPGQVMPGGGT